ncbi:hypothetical protein T4C_12508 [Trichinella pseudospiralis]|uniref:Uncharacterized protein n=1 Tax=Trichinella pseudospiralis TaxID=6337 RepID=A0A0V1JZG6_TRIPS|nr:hypothetical protein T4C_12508 [Trichinella pseudospiralis]
MPTSGYDEFAAIAVQSGPKWRISDSTTELLITSCSATISGLVYSILTCDRPSAGCTFTRQLLNNQNRQDHSAQLI